MLLKPGCATPDERKGIAARRDDRNRLRVEIDGGNFTPRYVLPWRYGPARYFRSEQDESDERDF